MAYKKADLEKQSLDAIRKHKLVFIEEVVAYLPCDKTTFYAHKLNESNSIKEALEGMKIDLKAGLRKKWYANENATTQVALYKIIGSDDEADRLNGSRQKIEQTVDMKIEGELELKMNKIYGED